MRRRGSLIVIEGTGYGKSNANYIAHVCAHGKGIGMGKGSWACHGL